ETADLQERLSYMEAGVNAILQHHGLDSAQVQFWRRKVHQVIEATRHMSPEKKPSEIYQFVLGMNLVHPDLALRFCREKLGDFPLPEVRSERKPRRKR